MEQLQSHIWLTASSISYMGKYLRISSYISKPFLTYDVATALLWISLYMRKKFLYFFYQCTRTRKRPLLTYSLVKLNGKCAPYMLHTSRPAWRHWTTVNWSWQWQEAGQRAFPARTSSTANNAATRTPPLFPILGAWNVSSKKYFLVLANIIMYK